MIHLEERHAGEAMRAGRAEPATRTLEAIHDRVESPADKLLGSVEPTGSMTASRQDESTVLNRPQKQGDANGPSENVTKNVTAPSETADQADEQLLLVIERWAELPPARRKMIVKLVEPSA